MHVFDTKDKTLVYKALSYCWGSEDSLLDVLVNGWSFQVTKNVFSFLSHTAVMKDNRCDWWFIDAICINQQDLSERSMQVSLMSDIYRNAAQVCIWLTDLEYDDYCDDVEHGESLDEDYYAMLKAESTGLWPDGTTATAEDIRACDAKLASVAGGLISQSRYWLRLWIVQEVIMAKKLMVQWRHYMWRGAVLNDLTFKYLPDMFGQLDSLVALNGIPLSPAVLFAGQARDALLAHVMCATVMQTKMLWGHFIRSGGFLPFYKVLSSFGAQSCSMIHDHIIGLLAMMNICVRPDYSMTSTQLLTVMVREFLVSMGFGRMLVHHNELGRADPKYLANLGTIIRSVLLFPLDNPVVMLVILEQMVSEDQAVAQGGLMESATSQKQGTGNPNSSKKDRQSSRGSRRGERNEELQRLEAHRERDLC
ncbi:Heterokaryon incompatibility protein 6, OR allele [Pseudocercospora fuligena]|uniref:Heterokaryon incompatibility protein 6, OR allele n=1 Tax=Pseudocercospora fuligena TaxID=685502 RepID=A0A8H6RPX3_9PEZI|nr:Heterokaryon incompatibility protein 6, OR allele [Pseudocercospora fuligena]